MEQWARGQFNGDNMTENSLMNAGALAEIRQLEKLLELTYEQLEEAFTDE